MKIILSAAVIFLCLSFISIQNPLEDTRWESNGFIMHFAKKDTVKMYMNDEVLAAAIYKVKDSTLIWKDLTVNEMVCDTSLVGKYTFHIENNILSFTLISDECDERGEALPQLVLSKQ